MQHPELVPLGMLAMMLAALPGLWLGRRITRWRTYLGVLALAGLTGWLAWYLRHSVDIGYFGFLFVPPMFCFALAMGSNSQAHHERMKAYRKRCLDAQYKQLETDRKHFNGLLAADTLADIARLHALVGEDEKALEAYAKAAEIYSVEKSNHPSLAAFYSASAALHRKAKRNLDADRLTALARECSLKVEY